jgi:hypothetical protein
MGGRVGIRARNALHAGQITGVAGVEPEFDLSVSNSSGGARPTPAQRRYLERGLDQPGGKLPLFDWNGQQIDHRTIKACIQRGWAEPWFANPIKPDWVVCRVTSAGKNALGD